MKKHPHNITRKCTWTFAKQIFFITPFLSLNFITATSQFPENSQIDTDDFKTLLLNQNPYIDKSMLIEHFLNLTTAENNSVLTILRPEGWGKTINVKMLETFFQIEVDEKGQPLQPQDTINNKFFLGGEISSEPNINRNLTPLKISNWSDALQHLGKHPVILLQLKNATGNTCQQIEQKIKSCIVEMYKQHQYLIHSTKITDLQKLKLYLSGEFDKSDLISSIYFLSQKLFEHFDQKVLVFVDDYDTPFISAYIHYHTANYLKVGKLLEHIYEKSLNTNPYRSSALFVGVYPIKTNVQVYYKEEHLLKPPFSEFFGLTQDEVKELLEKTSITADLRQLENWYGGFYVGQTNEYYNTRSVIRFVANQGIFDYYGLPISTDPRELESWHNENSSDIQKMSSISQNSDQTHPWSIPSALSERILITKDLDIYEMTKLFLINGHYIRSNSLFEAQSFGAVKTLDYLWSNHDYIYKDILFYSGYLTKNATGLFIGKMKYFDLFIPNYQIKYFYETKAFQWGCYILDMTTSEFQSLANLLLTSDIPKFEETLRDSLGNPKAQQLYHFGGHLDLYNAIATSLRRFLTPTHTIEYEYDGNNRTYYVTLDDYCILEYEMILIPKSNTSDTVIFFRYEYENLEEMNSTVEKGLTRIDQLHQGINLLTYSHVQKTLKINIVFFLGKIELRFKIDGNTPPQKPSMREQKKKKKRASLQQNKGRRNYSTSSSLPTSNFTTGSSLQPSIEK